MLPPHFKVSLKEQGQKGEKEPWTFPVFMPFTLIVTPLQCRQEPLKQLFPELKAGVDVMLILNIKLPEELFIGDVPES